MKIESSKIELETDIKKVFRHLQRIGWEPVKAREYQNTYIFRSPDGTKYLHFGDPAKLSSAIDVQSLLFAKGFPVSPVLKTGKFGKYSYTLETSLGNKTFGDIFEKNIDAQTFDLLCDIVKNYFNAQISNLLPAPADYDVRKEVMAENVIQENSDLEINLINLGLDKLQQRLMSVPFTYSHGDFAARNILNDGVIDFEFYSIAPIGLDVFTTCSMENFWMFRNRDGEIHAKIHYEPEHNQHLIEVLAEVCSEHGQDKLLNYQNDYILFKAFWSTAFEKQQALKSGDDTKWRFRRAVLMHCIEKYLRDEPIDTFDFQSLNKI